MALCTSPVYDNTTCYQYPPNKGFVCEDILGGKYVYASNNYDQIIQPGFDEKIKDILVYLELPLQNTICRNYLLLLICHYLYPLCIPNDKTNLWNKKQNLCSESCLFFHNELCVGKTDGLATLVSINYIQVDERFTRGIISILKKDCNNDQIYDKNYNENKKDCFFKKEYGNADENKLCHSNGYIYNGNTSTTVNNETCDNWTNACLNHAYIDYTNINASDKNYCRNPGGSRKQPWCFVDAKIGKWEFCDVPQCPAIDGNYTSWSEWSVCSDQCNKTRSRNCTNPSPKFGGKNCSIYGPNVSSVKCEEDECTLLNTGGSKIKEGTSSAIVAVIVVASVVVLIATFITTLVLYRKKKKENMIECEDVDPLKTTEDIVKFICDNDVEDELTVEEEKYIAAIYDHLKAYRKECLCINCIRSWLISLIIENEDKDILQKQITEMLEDLERYALLKKTTKDEEADEDGHSKTCFFEHQIKNWLQDSIKIDKTGYEKLQKNKEKDALDVLELTEGLFLLNGVKLYHRLERKKIPQEFSINSNNEEFKVKEEEDNDQSKSHGSCVRDQLEANDDVNMMHFDEDIISDEDSELELIGDTHLTE